MKKTKYAWVALLALPWLASCTDDDYKNITPKGDPVITVVSAGDAVLMGEDLTLEVNCRDNGGIDLSTLKAALCFSGEAVDETTIRTQSEGNYEVTLHVPFLQYVPNGQAEVKLTLQNVSTKSAVATYAVAVSRPHFSNMVFVASDGTEYPMTENGNYTYTTSYTATDNAFKGYFKTADNAYTFGYNGSEVALGQTGNMTFQCAETGTQTVTFNTCDYSYGPNEALNVTPLEFTNTDGGNTFVGILTQGMTYKFIGDDALNSDSWFHDEDFFVSNGNGTYTFNALTGSYTINADFKNNYFRIWAMNGGSPASINADGSGALWIIGSEGVNKPTWSAINHGWWTGTDSDLCLAQIREKVYQITLTVGQQLNASNVNFKFFGQPDWGTEFKGSGTSYCISTDNAYFGVGNGNGHDDGNLYVLDDVTLNNGETYVLTVDLTGGCANGKLSVTKK